MVRRVHLAVFLGLTSALVLATGLAAGAAPEDVQTKRGEVASAQERLKQVREDAVAARNAYNGALFELNKLDEQVKDKKSELKAAEEELDEAQKDLEGRASQVYKSGNVGFMDVLVGVEDFSSFATRMDVWLDLLAKERSEFERVREARNDIRSKKDQLEAQRAQRAETIDDAMKRRDAALEAEAEAETYLNSLSEDLRASIQAEQQRKAEAARAKAEELRRELAAKEAAEADKAAAEQVAAEQAAAEELAAERRAARQQAAEAAAQREAELAAQREAEAAAAEQAAADEAARQQAIEEEAAALAAQQQAPQPAGQQQYQEPAAPAPAAAPAPPASGTGNAVVAEAAKYLGTPYVLGGSEVCVPYEMMDCSCFTSTVYAAFGISMPDSPQGQLGYGTPVSGPPAAGDLLFWSEDGSGYVTHVGIAMGDGTTIHASAYAGYAVQGTGIDMIPGYIGARRLL